MTELHVKIASSEPGRRSRRHSLPRMHVLLAALLCSFAPMRALGASITWDPAESAGTTHYRIYQRTASEVFLIGLNYVAEIPASETRFELPSDIPLNKTYYWVVTSVGDLGMESEPSEEVSLYLKAEQVPVSSDGGGGGGGGCFLLSLPGR